MNNKAIITFLAFLAFAHLVHIFERLEIQGKVLLLERKVDSLSTPSLQVTTGDRQPVILWDVPAEKEPEQ